jgi:PAS domain S-box-containing protein
MADILPGRTKGFPISIPLLVSITSALAIVVNGFLMYYSRTEIFDPLFYIPIILVAYYRPRRGISFAGGCAVIYLLMATLILPVSIESALAILGHAGIFIIIGSVVSYLRLPHLGELATGFPFRLRVPPPPTHRAKAAIIRNLIILTTVIAIAANICLLFLFRTLIFDPLFFFPIILIAYFYPRQGVLGATCMALLFSGIVLTGAQGSPATMITGLLHAGILIIIGFVVSVLASLYAVEQEIHKRLAEIVESSHDAIIGETLDGTITDWNIGAERLYGYSTNEVVGKSISLLVPPDKPDEISRILETIRNGEAIDRYETERLTKDQRRIWVSLSISPIQDEAEGVIGASVIAFDITERKLAETALERANKKIYLFGRITRHDILNQVTALNIYHNLAEGMTDDPVALSYLDKAKKAADAINRLVQFTHEYQEIGAKKPGWFDVHTCFTGASAQFKESPVAFAARCTNVEIYADPLIDQAVYRLIGHSLDAGGRVTEIRCSCAEDAQGLTLVYEDNGAGIPAGERQRLFEKTSADNPQASLFLVREILSITGITITENGVEGTGARFEIRVPPGAYRFTANRGHEQPGRL